MKEEDEERWEWEIGSWNWVNIVMTESGNGKRKDYGNLFGSFFILFYLYYKKVVGNMVIVCLS